jgi:hypothetical protein
VSTLASLYACHVMHGRVVDYSVAVQGFSTLQFKVMLCSIKQFLALVFQMNPSAVFDTVQYIGSLTTVLTNSVVPVSLYSL